MLVGFETHDDAGVVRISDDQALVFTADFLTPLVDDPREWGRIASANSISDIYAMGAKPLIAINLLSWPGRRLGTEMMSEVMAGGADSARKAGCLIVGGHTGEDEEPKYGMAVVAITHPDRVVRNVGARPGDAIYLTKPIGTGVMAMGIRGETAAPDHVAIAIEHMTTLNDKASQLGQDHGVTAMTDVTGYGLMGHLSEMLGKPGGIGAELWLDAIPFLPGVVDMALAGALSKCACSSNRLAFGARVHQPEPLPDPFGLLLHDPQTSGGLLIAIPPERTDDFEKAAKQVGCPAAKIGAFTDTGKIHVRP